MLLKKMENPFIDVNEIGSAKNKNYHEKKFTI